MWKKLIVMILAVALVLSISACSDSGRDKDKHDRKDNIADNMPFDFEDEEQKPTEPKMSYTDQIALIVRNKNQWEKDDTEYYMPYSYAVTDLDQNGRLELIVTVCMGSGIFTYTDVWEVSEDFESIILCATEFGENYSQVDIAKDETTVYRDRDCYYYLFTDAIRSGWSWNATEKRVLSLQDGKIIEKPLASCTCDNYEDGTSDVNYYDAASNEISKKEYETIENEIFGDFEELHATFLWQSIPGEDFAQMENDELQSLFEESWQGFSVG